MASEYHKILATAKVRWEIEGTASLSDDGLLNVRGNVSPGPLYSGVGKKPPLGTMPVAFGWITGNFSCQNMGLVSLHGAPVEVGGSFDCGGNHLTSLDYAPRYTAQAFFCNGNLLPSLKGLNAKSFAGSMVTHGNPMTSLDGLPDSFVGTLIVSWHANLPLLRMVGLIAPKIRGNNMVYSIIEQHAGNDRTTLRARVLACQRDLINAGFKGNAKW
jgi:hypothetical protein